MKKLIDLLQKHLVPVAAKVGKQRHLSAIRDGFIAIMPIIIAGSMGTLFNYIDIDIYQKAMESIFGPGWTTWGGNLWWGTFATMSVFIAFTVPYNLAKSYDVDPTAAGTLSLANYFMFIPQTIHVAIEDKVGDITVPAELVGQQIGAWGNINWSFTGGTGLFAALLIGILTTELFVKLTKSGKLTINMPENVPPAVARSFAALLPVLIVTGIGGLSAVLIGMTGTNLFAFITKIIQAPLMKFGSSLAGALILPFTNNLLWFFGLHGGAILDPIMQILNAPIVDANLQAVQQGLAAPYVFCKPYYDAFIAMGGSGTTITLIVAIFVASKRKHYRSLAKLSAAPGVFNINESMTFGMPIVLNPIFMIPYLLVPVVLSSVAYFAISNGWVPPVTVAIPWTTPPIIGGFLATGGSMAGAILSAVNLALAFVIYTPFVILAERLEDKEEKAKEII